MAEEAGKGQTERVPPYISFNTLLTALDALRELTLDQIDRTVFPSFSGGTYSQLIGTLRWFELLDVDAVRPELRKLAAADEAGRKAQVRLLVEKSYPEKIVRGLPKFSPKQLEDALAEFGISGATKRKAAAFLINAAQYADLGLSPLLSKKRRGGSGGGPRKRRSRPDVAQQLITAAASADGTETSRTLSVPGVGTITLSASVNIFKLPPPLREAIFKINDILDEYEQSMKLTEYIYAPDDEQKR